MSASNGGISTLANIAAIPMRVASTGACGLYAFDPLFGFNDSANGSSHSFKVEEILHGRTPTVTRIVVTYRDLGVVTAFFVFTGSKDDGTQVTPLAVMATLGSLKATNKLCTKMLFPTFTAQNIQLTVGRLANAGPLSITKITMAGKVERQAFD